MRKKLISLITVLVSTVVFSTSASAKCGEVTITEMDWVSSAFITAVSTFLMEQGYGCKVTKIPSATITAATSLAETGKPDIATEMWVNSAPVYKKLEEKGKVISIAKVLSDGGEENWLIPAYLAEKHPELLKLENILKNPKLVGGRFHNCPVGWGCRVANDNLIKAWGMDKIKGLEIFNHGSGETLAAAMASAYADKKPWFGYYWAPTEILGKYPMKNVDIGAYNKKIHDYNSTADCATPGKSSYPAAPVVTGITKAFAASNPEITALMKNVSFSNDMIHKILGWQSENKASADEAAVYFLTNYKSTWKDWISKDAQKKLSKLL